jgi:hypothetical protein
MRKLSLNLSIFYAIITSTICNSLKTRTTLNTFLFVHTFHTSELPRNVQLSHSAFMALVWWKHRYNNLTAGLFVAICSTAKSRLISLFIIVKICIATIKPIENNLIRAKPIYRNLIHFEPFFHGLQHGNVSFTHLINIISDKDGRACISFNI